MQIARLVVASAVVFASAASADIDQTGRSVWIEMVTKQGCMIYAERYPKLETAAEFRRQNDFSWEGSGCEKGKILNGEGTMTETFVGNVDVRKGRMVNGVFDGPATLTSGSFFANIVYTRGCRFQDGSFDTACTPRPLTSSSHKRTLKSRK